jgi:type IV secretion system protein VirD4
VKLWPVLQDLTQLKDLYSARWETFLGNAGIVQMFANNDLTTLEFIERRLGRTTLDVARQTEVTQSARDQGQRGIAMGPEVHPLMTMDEAARFFARDDHLSRQLIISADRNHPMILQRIRYYSHPDFRERARDRGNPTG